MDCRQFLRLVDEAPGPRRSVRIREALQGHASSCEGCAELLALEAWLDEPVESVLSEAESRQFSDGVMGRVRSLAERRAPASGAETLPRFLWATTLAGLMLIAAGWVMVLVEQGFGSLVVARFAIHLSPAGFSGALEASSPGAISHLLGTLLVLIGLLRSMLGSLGEGTRAETAPAE